MPPMNEANTVTKLIFEYLKRLGYPRRESEFCDEQTFVRKKSGKSGPYDAAFVVDARPVLLVEAKRQGRTLTDEHVQQGIDYATSEDFDAVPPPFLLITNGDENLWFQRRENDDATFSFTRCEEVTWQAAKAARPGGHATVALSLKRLVRLAQRVRRILFADLCETYFQDGLQMRRARLGDRKAAFERILDTRRSFVDPTLKDGDSEATVRSVLSSIALSQTLKVLFVKMLYDLRPGEVFPNALAKAIERHGRDFPGILKAEPYDALPFSAKAEREVHALLVGVRLSEALVFGDSQNPIGDVWDGLVETEELELDVQVKSLGNVYTPHLIVKAMTDAAERALGSWKDKKVLEPSCGSGHFVREVYARMVAAAMPRYGGQDAALRAHRSVLENLRAVDVDPFAVQTTQMGIFLELYSRPGLWQRLCAGDHFDLGRVVRTADALNLDSNMGAGEFRPDLIIGNPPYGLSVTVEMKSAYGLGSPDSYGCFIARALDVLTEGGHLIYVVSSSFLTLKTHRALREKIFEKSALQSVHILHRSAFSGRDVFTAIVHVDAVVFPSQFAVHFPQRGAHGAVFRRVSSIYSAVFRSVSSAHSAVLQRVSFAS